MSTEPDGNEERMVREEFLRRMQEQRQEVRRTVEESAEARRVREAQRQERQRPDTGD